MTGHAPEGLDALQNANETGLAPNEPRNDVRGKQVFDGAHHHIGTVDDLLLDGPERRVRFLHVERAGFLGMGARQYLVPIDEVKRTDAEGLHLTADYRKIDSSPSYDPERARADHHGFWSGVYDYWGYEPYWSLGYVYPLEPFYDAPPAPATEDTGGWRGD